MKKILTLTLITYLFFILPADLLAKNTSSQVEKSSQIKNKQIKKLKKWYAKKHPGKTHALIKTRSIPEKDVAEKNKLFFKTPSHFSMDQNENLYLIDNRLHKIFIFNSEGKFIKHFGQKGEGPGEFLNPWRIFSTSNELIIYDTRNSRVNFFDKTGNFIRTTRIFKTYWGMILMNSNNSLLGLSPHGGNYLMEEISLNGKLLLKFGKLLTLGRDKFNDSNISASNNDNKIYVAFKFFPRIRMYSSKGDFLSEGKINHINMKRQKKFNLNPEPKHARAIVIGNIKAIKNKIFLLKTWPCLEVIEVNEKGDIQNAYLYEERKGYHSSIFEVKQENGHTYFYILNSSEQCIDVFKAAPSNDN